MNKSLFATFLAFLIITPLFSFACGGMGFFAFSFIFPFAIFFALIASTTIYIGAKYLFNKEAVNYSKIFLGIIGGMGIGGLLSFLNPMVEDIFTHHIGFAAIWIVALGIAGGIMGLFYRKPSSIKKND